MSNTALSVDDYIWHSKLLGCEERLVLDGIRVAPGDRLIAECRGYVVPGCVIAGDRGLELNLDASIGPGRVRIRRPRSAHAGARV